LGVASVSKAQDATTPVAAVGIPVWSGMAQETGIQRFQTNASGPNGGFTAGLQNVRLGATVGIDADDTLTLTTSLAAGFATGFKLLDGYDVRKISGVWDGLTLKVGQFKVAFGQDGYLNPEQLIRINYSLIDTVIPFAAVNNGVNQGDNYLVGAELDQTYSDLTFQLAAVQSLGIGAITPSTGTKFDYVGRAQWKSSNLSLGLSDYLQSTSTASGNPNSLGANASVSADVFKLDLEAIFGASATNGYTGTLSAKLLPGFQPAAWYEWTTTSAGANTGADDLGAGVNFDLAAKTRLAFDVDFTGSNYGDVLAINTETVQLQEVF
jgi:hypothetical protein